jgi:hypothetical protein
VSEKSVGFVKQLAAPFPGLAALLDEHIKENFGEVLPHVFFGDVTRYLVSLLLAISGGGDLTQRRELCQTLDRLEEGYSRGDEELQELIAVSFLENLPRPGEPGSQIRSMLGPSLSKQLRTMG